MIEGGQRRNLLPCGSGVRYLDLKRLSTMRKHPLTVSTFLVLPVLILVAGAPTNAGENSGAGKWTGYVTDTWCGVNRDTKPPTADCTAQCVNEQGAKYALYNLADGSVYVLNPQSLASRYAGKRVVVKGTLDGKTVHMTTMRGDREGKTITASSISPE
jgi:hypothetical protein